MVFYSHSDPYKKLIKHLQEVAELSIRYGDERFVKAHQITGYAHDFGKYTTYFQDDRLFKKATWGDKANHAYLSAIFGAFLCAKNDKLKNTMFPALVFSSILSHHGDIKEFNSKDYLSCSIHNRAIQEKFNIINSQIDNMKKNLDFILQDFSKIGLHEEVKEFIQERELYKNIINILNKRMLIYEDDPDENMFLIHQILYSALISADKMSAARLEPVDEKNMYFNDLIKRKNDIISTSKPCRLNDIRNEIFKSVLSKLKKVYKEHSIFSITAPTGTGKTYTGFFCAKSLQEMMGYRHKIVYALPFTSIIDQNYQKIEELHHSADDFEQNKSSYIIKHHHLSNQEYINTNEDYRKDGVAELLIENWESGIIVTTFVQLLQTLIGNRNRMLKKYHVLTRSIILLDEVQAIPVQYFKLVTYAFQNLVALFDCKIIFMTATKPFIIPSTMELLDDSKKYFSMMQRTTLIPKPEKITIQEFCSDFMNSRDPEKSYLIVCNTIAQSLKVYNILSDNENNHDYIYLSTNLLPLHRKEIIKKLEEAKDKKKYVLVSTQVIEAGVDLDFDEVVRDIGPLDSIIQCAGRCNRRWKNKNGNITVIDMVNDKGYGFAARVYGSVIVNITRELLKNKISIPEKDYGELIQEYYEKISSGKISMKESKDLIEAMKLLDFNRERGVGTFSLIEDNRDYINLYIEYDDSASSLINEYKAALLMQHEIERRNRIREVRRKMLRYFISVPMELAKRYQPFPFGNLNEYIIEKDDITRHYNKITGLKRTEDFDMFCF